MLKNDKVEVVAEISEGVDDFRDIRPNTGTVIPTRIKSNAHYSNPNGLLREGVALPLIYRPDGPAHRKPQPACQWKDIVKSGEDHYDAETEDDANRSVAQLSSHW